MLGETNGGSSGGGSLFKVTGYTELPISGKYGNVAVITSNSIGYWDAGATAPTQRADGGNLQNGDVFIEITTESILNIVKKNAIRIGVASCKQFSNGAWSNVKAYYYDTEWHKFSDVMLYVMKNGVFSDEYTFKSASGTWEQDPYAVFSPYDNSWVWTYNPDGYRYRDYDSVIRWLKLTSLYHVGSFKKIGMRYSLKTYDTTVCQYGYNTTTSSGSSVTDFTNSPKYITLTGTGVENVTTAYIDIDSGHTDVTPFVHVYNADMRIYDIWFE